MKLRSILLLVPACWLSACAIEPKRVEPPVTRAVMQAALPSEVDRLLGYAMHARKLEGRAFATERDQLRNSFQKEQSEFSRAKLAVLLVSTPASAASASDDTEIVTLLEPLVRNTNALRAGAQVAAGPTEIRALAMLLYGLAQDRKKLRDQSRDAQARVYALRRDDSREMETRALRARVDELERKLAALKMIDSSVNRRAEVERSEPQRIEPAK